MGVRRWKGYSLGWTSYKCRVVLFAVLFSRKPTYCTFVTKIRCSTTQSHLWWCSESESTASSSLLSSWTEQFIGYEKNPWIDQKKTEISRKQFSFVDREEENKKEASRNLPMQE
jgi:hypothetical protein